MENHKIQLVEAFISVHLSRRLHLVDHSKSQLHALSLIIVSTREHQLRYTFDAI